MAFDIVTIFLFLYVIGMYVPAAYLSYRVWRAGGFSRTWGIILFSDVLIPITFWVVILLASIFSVGIVPGSYLSILVEVMFLAIPTSLVAGLFYLWRLVRSLGTRDK